MRLDLECPVHCADAEFGELADLVIDPATRCVTHLVVQPREQHHLARLVPIGRAQFDAPAGDGIRLNFRVGELNKLEPLHESRFVQLDERPVDPTWEVGIQEISQMPMSGSLGVNALGAGMDPVGFDNHGTLSYDRIPKGTVEIRRTSEVTSSDGHHVGHVVGLVLDEKAQIDQLVLEHGHLWGKREMTIPVGSIDRIESDEVLLTLSSDEVKR
jgi:sporulation protein YlmC with PRC-barrel domain